MSIRIDQCILSLAPGCVLGLIGHDPAGVSATLAAAPPSAWVTENLSALSAPDRLAWLEQAEQRRRAGHLVIAASSDPESLRGLADEVWWLDSSSIVERGLPNAVIPAYLSRVYRSLPGGLHPSLRRGDGRASITSIHVLDDHHQPTALLHSGQPASIAVTVHFAAPVADPIIGIMIRTRIGFEVFGTNTELEHLPLGPVAAADSRTVTFHFLCHLCPQSYTVTAASHDPDGVWHEWLEDAIAFTVTDSRYTAGVANLRARAELS
ncbi:MAG: Wzt carbohydrate-binding domain-containing protein [Acidobacteriota bacterium]